MSLNDENTPLANLYSQFIKIWSPSLVVHFVQSETTLKASVLKDTPLKTDKHQIELAQNLLLGFIPG